MSRIILPPRLQEERRRQLADLEAREAKLLQQLQDDEDALLEAVGELHSPLTRAELWLGIIILAVGILFAIVGVFTRSAP